MLPQSPMVRPMIAPLVPSQPYRATLLALLHEQLAAGCAVRLHVVSASMRPLLRCGDEVQVVAVQPTHLQMGDIVVVLRDGALITHRLLARDAQGWRTRGDSCRWLDPPVADAAIVGRVVAVVRGGAVIDLQALVWRLANRLLGWVAWLETRLGQADQRGSHQMVSLLLKLAVVSVALRLAR